MNTVSVVWLAVAVIAVFAEVMTSGLVAIWFAPAALVAMVLALVNAPLWLQIAAFVIIAGVLAALLYEKVHKSIRAHSEKTNLDAIIGSQVTVEEPIEAGGFGRVTVKGVSWKATCPTAAAKGDKVTVEKIDGVVLICK